LNEGRKTFSWKARARSFRYAWRGLVSLVREEHNARIHAGATLAVVVLGWALRIESWQWLVLMVHIGSVWAAEAFNAAIEALADALHPEHHPLIARAKDFGAGAVLALSIAAAVSGLTIFLPALWARLG
jgi:diacylglycerol kinase (ATP)